MSFGEFDDSGFGDQRDDARVRMGEAALFLVNSHDRILEQSRNLQAGSRQTLESMLGQVQERSRNSREQAQRQAGDLLAMASSGGDEAEPFSPPPEEPERDCPCVREPSRFTGCQATLIGEDGGTQIYRVRFSYEGPADRVTAWTGDQRGFQGQWDGLSQGNHAIQIEVGPDEDWVGVIVLNLLCSCWQFGDGDPILDAVDCVPGEPLPPPPEDDPQPPSQPPPGECDVCKQAVCCCPPPEPPKPPEPPLDLRYQVWRRAEGNRDCYVISNRQDPEGLDDMLLREFKEEKTAQQYAQEHCDTDPPGPPEPPDEPTPIPSLQALLDGCDLEGLERLIRFAAQSPEVFADSSRQLEEPLKIALSILKALDKIPGLNLFTRFLIPLTQDAKSILPVAADLLAAWAGSSGCGSKPFLEAKGIVFLLDIIEKWVGFDLNPWGQQVRYIVNGMCPYIQPSAADAVQGWLNGSLTTDRLRTLMELNGACYDDWKPLILGQRTKLAPGQLIESLYRGYIDRATFERELRSSGFVEEKDYEVLEKLGIFIPPVTDLVRFMVRDVEDTRIVGRFNLDADFEEKYRGPLKEFAQQQGMSDEVMRRYWRAHWTIPSPTQLYEMYHRLRFESDPELKTSLEDVETALRQQDILPTWIPRLLAISFNPLTRVDTRRAFDLGDIDVEGVRKSYRAQGYNDENVETLVKFSSTLKSEGIDGQTPLKRYKQHFETREAARLALEERGFDPLEIDQALRRVEDEQVWTSHSMRPYRQYTDGLLDEFEFRAELAERRIDDLVIDRIVRQANREIERQSRKQCIQAIRTRYFWGEIERDELREELIGLGVPGQVAQVKSEQFQCELVSAERQGTLREFARWLEYGVATPQEVQERLRKLKYDEQAARTIVAGMLEKVRRRDEKEAEREQARIEKELRREERERKRTAKQQQQLLERARKAAIAAKDAREKRALQLEKAAIKYADKFDADLETTSDRLQALRLFIRGATALNRDREVEAVVRAVDASVKLENPDLENLAQSIADSLDDWLEGSGG